jgi:hypothetical protein
MGDAQHDETIENPRSGNGPALLILWAIFRIFEFAH